MNAAQLDNLSIRWTREQVRALYEKSFMDLLFEAHQVHRQHFPQLDMQLSTLLNVKTGGCPEDCSYCPQAARYHTGVKAQKLMSVEDVKKSAQCAKEAGASRFCMGAAWRELHDRDLPKVTALVREIRDMGMETCMTLGMLTEEQAQALKEAGLEYYNHNLDTSPEHYSEIISTHTQDERLETLKHVRTAGMKVCCGGIVGLGESREDRVGLLTTLANLDPYPESVPINQLVRVPGTPLESNSLFDPIEFVRTVAVARIMMPTTRVRLSAGRTEMSDEQQALCFFAGANSIHYGEKLLMTANPQMQHDRALLEKLGIPTQ